MLVIHRRALALAPAVRTLNVWRVSRLEGRGKPLHANGRPDGVVAVAESGLAVRRSSGRFRSYSPFGLRSWGEKDMVAGGLSQKEWQVLQQM